MNRRKEPITFGFFKPSDWLGKLSREIERIEKVAPGQKDELIDHGINFAITAWHMGEWAWSTFNRNPKVKSQIANCIGCSIAELTCDRFKIELCKQPLGLISLDYCRIITTSAKHIGVDRDDPNFDVTVSAGPTTNLRRDTSANFLSFDAVPQWRLKIRTGEDSYPALDAYREVLNYWENFFRTYPVTS